MTNYVEEPVQISFMEVQVMMNYMEIVVMIILKDMLEKTSCMEVLVKAG